jgi:protein required for attachment to host cells
MKLWILVANAAGARFLEMDGLKESPRLIHSIAHPQGRAKAQDLVSDRPGRVHDGSGSDSMGATTGPKEVVAEEFVRQIAAFLRKEYDARRFAALAILAPAHFLGLIRESLAPEVRKTVVFGESKDLAHIETGRLAPHLAEAAEAGFREIFARSAAH